jgi:CrcB protein
MDGVGLAYPHFSGANSTYAYPVKQHLKPAIAVLIGGFLGSLARLLASLGTEYLTGDSWPLGTLLVNVSGSFALGYLTANGMGLLPAWTRLGITTGFLGAFTTLSAISLDVAMPLAQGDGLKLMSIGPYAVGSAIIGVVSAIVGLRLGESQAKRDDGAK